MTSLQLQPVRGTHDLLPDEARLHRHVEETALKTASLYGFGEIITPIFEFTQVFTRTLGDTSDVVTKEMYTFTDRGGESITLRPEGTAGVARAFISGGLQQNLPLKLFYRGPMFRYERPQKGRLRQFHQVGIELLGVDNPKADIEVIVLAQHFLDNLGLEGKTQLELNSLGDSESRTNYRQVLVEYLSDFKDKLSKDSQERLLKNPLRVLDSKDESDKKIVMDAPLLSANLNQLSLDFQGELLEGLKALGINYKLNPRLVRGLDYYCHTAFEFTTDLLGAQGTVLAGGRYDGLIGEMGGPKTPGVGWAAGVERLSLLANPPKDQNRPIAIIPGNDEIIALKLAHELRKAGLNVELGFSGNMGKRMKKAAKLNAKFVVFLGPDELSRGNAIIRNLDAGEQSEVPLNSVTSRLMA